MPKVDMLLDIEAEVAHKKAILERAFISNPALTSIRRRIRKDVPSLEDARIGTARVTSRGKVVWVKRLNKRLRKVESNHLLALAMSKVLTDRIREVRLTRMARSLSNIDGFPFLLEVPFSCGRL